MDRRAFFHLPTQPTPEDFFAYWARQAPPLFRIGPEHQKSRLLKLLGPSPWQPRPAVAKNGQEPQPLNIKAGLEVYAEELDRIHAAHLLRRAAGSAHPDEIDALIGKTAEAAVDEIVDAAIVQPLPEPPVWVDESVPRDQDEAQVYFNELNPMWLNELYTDLMRQVYYGGLRERMAMFWHNHFVTEIDTYFIAPVAHRYLTLLRTHALGNFKDFVHAVGTDIAMLVYLNGIQNEASAPNENYGRELLELFSMGQFDGQGNENYTQETIEEIARALTGWLIDPYELTAFFLSLRHDFGEKTIFGRTGNWGYDDVIDILFEERAPQIAEFIARKIYAAFVYAAPDEDLVAELAQVFLDNDFEIAPVVRAILKSAHLHDDDVIGAQIKSPVSMMTGLLRESGAEPDDNLFFLLYFGSFILDQQLLNPPNVAGWPGHHDWLNTSSFTTRWLASEFLIFGDNNLYPALDLRPLSETVLANDDGSIDPADPASVFPLAVALAEYLLPVPLDTLDLSAPSEGFAGDLDSNPIPDEVLNGPAYALDLAKIFLLGQFPWYEWSLEHDLAQAVLTFYARSLSQLPEFQLT